MQLVSKKEFVGEFRRLLSLAFNNPAFTADLQKLDLEPIVEDDMAMMATMFGLFKTHGYHSLVGVLGSGNVPAMKQTVLELFEDAARHSKSEEWEKHFGNLAEKSREMSEKELSTQVAIGLCGLGFPLLASMSAMEPVQSNKEY